MLESHKMLKIQRASAGSGKTYALAKKYIINILAYPVEQKTWKLRNEKQMEDALKHLLAITFTNKATNEMKQRIVNNLSRLSEASILPSSEKNYSLNYPYLKEIGELTAAPPNEIGLAAKIALKVILNNYSWFKISTIDSFFQEILRTFTYEANINEAYQLELDSDYINSATISDAINELDSNKEKMGNASFWLKTLISQESKRSQKWNLFNKKNTKGSIYSSISQALMQLESENYKSVKDILDEYFYDPVKKATLVKSYLKLKEKANEERDRQLKEIKLKLTRCEEIMTKTGVSSDMLKKTFSDQIEKIRNLKQEDKAAFSYSSIQNSGSVFLQKHHIEGHPLNTEAKELYDLIDLWKQPNPDSYYKNWVVYSDLIPYLGLLVELRQFLTEVLDKNNLLQLSDTGYILKKIIGEDDAPFVFERLGNRIDTYLIDEFQDTSRMQWDILRPLITEGLSKDKESLIIGDPKQSIYRFRNADHTLITNVVPEEFPHHIPAGFSQEDNTNWRSHTKIVKFNNYFFKTLASAMMELSESKGLGYNFNDLYSNVMQFPHNQDNKGYVEISFLNKTEEDRDDEEGEETDSPGKDWFEKKALMNLGPLVSSLLLRGYRQSDIGILVNKNNQGRSVIETLIDYNNKMDPKEKKIDFISEESLLISSSPAVEILVGIIEKLSNPGLLKNKVENGSEENKNLFYDWKDLKINYNIYSSSHPEMPAGERIINFLEGINVENSIPALLKSLPTPSLASLVEESIKTFLDENLRKREALYISSFQDILNEYLGAHLNDPATFLEWWKTRGQKLSVASPDGIDAVQIMTVHKSKGLEFPCVIIPFANESFVPSNFKEEWRWVQYNELPDIELPPVIPVRTTSKLLGSRHENIYKKYCDQIITDNINSYYVAFTRARNELYIFTKEISSRGGDNIQTYLDKFLRGYEKTEAICENDTFLIDKKEILVNDSSGENNEKSMVKITIGKPFTPEEIRNEQSKDKAGDVSNFSTHYFSDYFVNSKRPGLRSKASKVTPSGEIENN